MHTANHQESVWDYPRPPRVEDSHKHIRVIFNGVTIAETRQAKRVLETSHPPVYYIPREDFRADALSPTERSTWCEWKGLAAYFDVASANTSVANAAWSYPNPTPAFSPIAGHVAVYPALVDECRVDGVPVRPQPGGFYGGWVTPDIVGPFKGEPGTQGW